MNFNQIIEHTYPFQHWEMIDCLDKNTLDEILLHQFLMEKELTMVQEQLIILVKEKMGSFVFL